MKEKTWLINTLIYFVIKTQKKKREEIFYFSSFLGFAQDGKIYMV